MQERTSRDHLKLGGIVTGVGQLGSAIHDERIAIRLAWCRVPALSEEDRVELAHNAFKAAINSGKLQIGLWSTLCSNVAAEVVGKRPAAA